MKDNGAEFLNDIFLKFFPDRKIRTISPFGSGHINDTYLVETSGPPPGSFILQKINTSVFRDPEGLIRNILLVTGHIRRYSAAESPEKALLVPELQKTTTGEYCHREPSGSCWRLYPMIDDSHSFDRIETNALAREAGRAFGLFQYLTAGIDTAQLTETLPMFHRFGNRLNAFRLAVMNDPAGRKTTAGPEIAYAEQRVKEMEKMDELTGNGLVPCRVTHNDTKINNVLFSRENRAIAIIDLDTVMPGSLLYDFGDAIRTGACTADEDEPDRSRVAISLPLFRAYAEGFLHATSSFITPAEREHLVFSARFMTYLIGLRFLTDHLNGDTYYRTRFPGHNLQRARAQFALLESMENLAGEMEQCIRELS